MSKSINWPAACLTAILKAESGQQAIALRLNPIYAQHRYWQSGDVVDVRVESKPMRQAEITETVKCCPINELNADDLALMPLPAATIESVKSFLAQTYNATVTDETPVCVVHYCYR